MVQKSHLNSYSDAKDRLLDEIKENEGTTIMEDMLKERRDWITDYRAKNLNKIPDDLKGFHERFNTETPLSPEEEAAKKAADEEDGKGKKGKAKAKDGGKKKGKGKKGKGGKKKKKK
jgi:hypothetical protein